MHRSRANVYSSCVALASLFMAGCTVKTIELLEINFEQSYADVDIDCAGGCGGSDRLDAEISLQDSAQLPDDAVVEFTQYRVTYELSAQGAPAFETLTSVAVGKGQSAPFAPSVAGDAQRQWAAGVGGTVDGRGTITVVGTDHEGNGVELVAKFEVRFADFAATTTGSSSGAGGSGAGGSGAGGN